jgi:hypothetical protein
LSIPFIIKIIFARELEIPLLFEAVMRKCRGGGGGGGGFGGGGEGEFYDEEQANENTKKRI